jgi:hypothetical protein
VQGPFLQQGVQEVGTKSEWDAPLNARHFWNLACTIVDPKALPPDDMVSRVSQHATCVG